MEEEEEEEDFFPPASFLAFFLSGTSLSERERIRERTKDREVKTYTDESLALYLLASLDYTHTLL